MNTVENVSVKSISCAIPKRSFTLLDYAPNLLDEQTAKRMTKKTGFASLRIAPDDVTASDLIVHAAEPVLNDVDRSEIGAVVLVSKTQDYTLPATSRILQDRLGLGNDILCIDINEGCPGYITGLYTSFLLAQNMNRSVLLTVGDTSSKLLSPNDRTTRCLFGDAGTASLIAPTDGGGLATFEFACYGERFDLIIIENSRSRKVEHPKNDGFMYVDGFEVMNFALNEVPALIEKFLAENRLSADDISLYACHQANRKILTSLADRLNIPQDKIPFVMSDTGNVSSASIPLMLTRCSGSYPLDRVLCCGFGVGLAIGICLTDFSKTKFYGVFELE